MKNHMLPYLLVFASLFGCAALKPFEQRVEGNTYYCSSPKLEVEVSQELEFKAEKEWVEHFQGRDYQRPGTAFHKDFIFRGTNNAFVVSVVKLPRHWQYMPPSFDDVENKLDSGKVKLGNRIYHYATWRKRTYIQRSYVGTAHTDTVEIIMIYVEKLDSTVFSEAEQLSLFDKNCRKVFKVDGQRLPEKDLERQFCRESLKVASSPEDILKGSLRKKPEMLTDTIEGLPASDYAKVSGAAKAVKEPIQKQLKGGKFPDPILASLEAEHHRIDQRYNFRHKLAIFPWMEKKDSVFSRTYLIDALNQSIEKTRIFVPIFSYYELSNNYNTKVIRSLMTEYPAKTLFTKTSRGVSKPRIDFICELGTELGVDAVFTCYSRMKDMPMGSASTSGTYLDTYIELSLIDVRSTRNHKRVIKGTLSDVELRLLMEKSLLELFEEFPEKN